MNYILRFLAAFSLLFLLGDWLLSFNFKTNSVLAQLQFDYKTYTESNTFSIDYPQGWMVERLNRDYVMFWSQKPASGGGAAPVSIIKTDITLVRSSYEKSVKECLSSIRGDGSKLIKKGNLIIGGKEALRIWTTSSSFDFPDTIISIIRYGARETAIIYSYYTASNSNAVNTIQRIHWSYRVLK